MEPADLERDTMAAALRAALEVGLGSDVSCRQGALGLTCERTSGRVARYYSIRVVRPDDGTSCVFFARYGQGWNWDVVDEAARPPTLAAEAGAGGEPELDGGLWFVDLESAVESVRAWLIDGVSAMALRNHCKASHSR